MKRLLVLSFVMFLSLQLWAIAPGKNGTHDGYSDGSSARAVTWTGGGSNTSGSCLVVTIVDVYSASINYSISDGANTYLSSMTVNANGTMGYIFYIYNASPATTITVTPSGWTQDYVLINEYTGIATSSALDKNIAAYDNGYDGGTSWTGNATGTLGQASEIVIADNIDCYCNTTITTYAGSGYTVENYIGGAGILSKVVSATDSQTPGGTINSPTGDYRIYTKVFTLKGSGATLQKVQSSSRWRNDDGSESAATWRAAENTQITESSMTNVGVRFVYVSSNAATSANTPTIEYKRVTDSSYSNVPTAQVGQLPAYVKGIGTVAGTTGALTLTEPASIANGDLELAVIESTGGVYLSGWTLCPGCPVTTAISASGYITTSLSLYYVYRGASVPNLVAVDNGDHAVGRTFTIANAATSSPFDVTTTSACSVQTKSVVMPSITSTVNNYMYLSVVTSSADATSTSNFGSATNANVTGLTKIIDNLNTSGNGGGFGVYVGTIATAGAIGETTLTTVNSSRQAIWVGSIKYLPATYYEILLNTSTYCVVGGSVPTTAQLNTPAGCVVGDFESGEMLGQKNPALSMSDTANHYTEIEWRSLQATPYAVLGTTWQFRLNGMNLYPTTTAQWLVQNPAAAATSGASGTQHNYFWGFQ